MEIVASGALIAVLCVGIALIIVSAAIRLVWPEQYGCWQVWGARQLWWLGSVLGLLLTWAMSVLRGWDPAILLVFLGGDVLAALTWRHRWRDQDNARPDGAKLGAEASRHS